MFLKASFFDQFKNALNGADFNVEGIKKNKSLSIREKKGVSVNECARLCLTEPSFDCQSMSYEAVVGECKWSSFVGALADYVTNAETYVIHLVMLLALCYYYELFCLDAHEKIAPHIP